MEFDDCVVVLLRWVSSGGITVVCVDLVQREGESGGATGYEGWRGDGAGDADDGDGVVYEFSRDADKVRNPSWKRNVCVK